MNYSAIEGRYLLDLLSAVINQRKPPEAISFINWENIYKLANVHNVASMAYYSILALNKHPSEIWMEKFRLTFQRSTAMMETQDRETEKIQTKFEQGKICSLMMKDYVMKFSYPQQEMRSMDCVSILVEEGKSLQVDSILKRLDYSYESTKSDGCDIYCKYPFARVAIYRSLIPKHWKIYEDYFDSWKKNLGKRDGFHYIYEMEIEDFYIYLMGYFVGSFASGNADICSVMDLWIFLKNYKEFLDWTYIDKELDKLEIREFTKHVEILTSIFFSNIQPIEPENYDAMEKFLISKGSYGKEICMTLLPMITKMEGIEFTANEEANSKKVMNWLFPNISYMEGLFPFLKQKPSLLLFCWFLRLARFAYYPIRKLYRRMVHFLKICAKNGSLAVKKFFRNMKYLTKAAHKIIVRPFRKVYFIIRLLIRDKKERFHNFMIEKHK